MKQYKTVTDIFLSSRNYATLREIETRLKSIKNIEKITATMKIVASTKLNKAQRAMTVSRVYNAPEAEVFKTAETKAPEPTAEGKKLIISATSDKGLCGSIHSSIARATRARLAEFPTADVVAIGEKTKAQLSRTHPNNLVLSFSGIGKEVPTFTEAALVIDQIIALGKEYETIEIFYNKFTSGVSFDSVSKPVFTAKDFEASTAVGVYDVEVDDTLSKPLAEFNLVNSLYAALAEGHASEISARRNSMDNASKNAGDMISKYSILYNRTRQAVITNELVDIITGASSLD